MCSLMLFQTQSRASWLFGLGKTKREENSLGWTPLGVCKLGAPRGMLPEGIKDGEAQESRNEDLGKLQDWQLLNGLKEGVRGEQSDISFLTFYF